MRFFIPPLLLVFFYIIGTPAAAQISGRVTSSQSNNSIAGASVFISNTTRGTTTDNNGNFTLNNIPSGMYELVVSALGYTTYVYAFNTDSLPVQLEVLLLPKKTMLQNVDLEPYVEEGWERWGRVFSEYFLGVNPNGLNCVIKNKEKIKFRRFTRSNRLIAYCNEPIVIDNKALGYKLKFQLEDFEVNFKAGYNYYTGFTFFEESKDGNRVNKKREETYNGSLMHFLRSLYANELEENEFEVKRMQRIYNTEKQRARNILSAIMRIPQGDSTYPADSITYFRNKVKEKDYTDVYDKNILTADSLLKFSTVVDAKNLLFKDYIYVLYKGEKESKEYLNYTGENRPPYFQRSWLMLTHGTNSVTLYEDGNASPPQNLMNMGYWGWNERVGSMLPRDYKPDKKK